MNNLISDSCKKRLKNNNLFSLSRDLFNEYCTIKFNKDLTENYFRTISKYYSESDTKGLLVLDIRKTYNDLINRYYQNEIIIKANFINNVILKTKHHVTIFELNSGTSRVDLCKVNGSSIAYEIKTDLDNLSRLDKQLGDYLRIFEKVFVICSKSKIANIIEKIPNDCGIYTYSVSRTGRYIFELEKNAQISQKLESKTQLNLLTTKQLISIARYKKQTTRNELIKLIIKKYNCKTINRLFKEQIKNKYQAQWQFIESNHDNIFEIDYQWFFKNNVSPDLIYK